MKQKRNTLLLVLIALTLGASLLLSSCNVGRDIHVSIGQPNYEYDDDGIGDILDDTADGTDKNSGTTPPDSLIPDNDEEKEDNTPPQDQDADGKPDTDQSGDVGYAAGVGLRSTLSIYASFRNGTSAGSGVIYDLNVVNGSAFIITNYHVLYNESYGLSTDINCYLFGMESAEYAIPATFVGGSPNYDIAVLRIDDSKIIRTAGAHGSITAADFANSDYIFPGQSAIAIGNPNASGISVTAGIVSVDSEYLSILSSTGTGYIQLRVLRIDTAVNSGNSGGGLYDSDGRLIGIVNAKIASTEVENIGYAIPSNVARAIADNIIYYCYGKDCTSVMRAMLGVTVTVSSLSTYYDAETGMIEKYEEVTVYEVSSGGLGERMFEVGDVLKSITIGNKTVNITRQHHLIDAMLDARVGDTVTITLIRDGQEKTVSTTLTSDCLAAY